ncbi:hypothetical protein D3C80_2198150 [compost metagenome]
MQLVGCDAESFWIDRPAPFGLVQIWIGHGAKYITTGHVLDDFRVCAGRPARIVAESDIVNGMIFQNSCVA